MDSDSDWDSLPGDPEPPSEYEPSPKKTVSHTPVPAPPSHQSPRLQHQNNNTSTPLRKAIKANKHTAIPIDTATNSPNKLYKKTSGVTSFVDNSNHSIRHSNNSIISNDQLRLDSNSNPVISSPQTQPLREKQGIELNDFKPSKDEETMGHTNQGFRSNEVDPPYTNFRTALPANDAREYSNQPDQRKRRIKSAYVRNKTPEYLDDTISQHSSPREEWSQHNHDIKQSNGSQGNQLYAVVEGPIDGQGCALEEFDEGCCVPYQKKTGTGYTYIFNHGKTNYLNVVPEWREPYMKSLGDRSGKWLGYFWQEVFGAIGLIVDFGLIFLLELMKFTFRKVLVRLLVGFIVIFGDHFLKPVLTASFNSLLQPTMAFIWNVFVGLRNGVRPLLDITKEIVLQMTTLLKGFRLFELIWKPNIVKRENISEDFANRNQIKDV